MPLTTRQLLFAAAALFVAAAFIYFYQRRPGALHATASLSPFAEKQKRNRSNESSPHQTSGRDSAKTKTVRDPSETPAPYDHEALSRRIAGLDLEGLRALMGEIASLLAQHPAEAERILQLYSSALNQHDPGQALRFLSNFQHPAAKQLAHTFAQEWRKNDEPGLRTHLFKLALRESGNEHDLDQLMAHLIQSPDGALVPNDWIAWADSLKSDPKIDAAVQGTVLQTLLTKIDPADTANYHRLKDAYTARFRDEAFQRFIPQFTETLAKHEPAALKDLLELVPGGLYREIAIEQTMGELGRSNPEVATEWLSSPDANESIFSPNDDVVTTLNEGLQGEEREAYRAFIRSGQNEMFDRAITRYIESLVINHPEDALANIAAVRNPKQRSALTKMVQNLIDAKKQREIREANFVFKLID